MLIRVFIVAFIFMLMNSSNGLLQKHHQKVGTPVAGMTEGESEQKPRVIKRFAVMTNAQKNAKTAARLRELRREVEENRRFDGLHQASSIAGVRRRYEKYGPALPYNQVTPHATEINANSTSNRTDAITAPSVTMSESLDTYFRPIDGNVPRDHLVPFQEFGKKLHHRHRVKTTTINTNTLESTTHRSKEYSSNIRNSNVEEETHEEMDVTFSKPYTEQNKVTRPHHIMLINPAGRRVMVSSNNTEEIIKLTTEDVEVEITTRKTKVLPSMDQIILGINDMISDSETASSNITYKVAKPEIETKIDDQKENEENDDLEKLSKSYLKLREESSLIEDVNLNSTTMKPKTNRTSTGFTLLHRTRGQINGAKKNMTANRKMLKERADSNYENAILNSTARARSVVKNDSYDVELGKNLTNDLDVGIVKPKRGNAMYTILNSTRRLPKLVDAEAEVFNKENIGTKIQDKLQEPATSTTLSSTTTSTTPSPSTTLPPSTTTTTTTPKPTTQKPTTTTTTTTTQKPTTTTTTQKPTTTTTTTTQPPPSTTSTTERVATKDPHYENPTSKILSTAVVTSISVLGDWTPLLPDREIENTTSYIETSNKPPIVNITPRYVERSRGQTKETVQVSYSKSIPGPPVLRINTTTNSVTNLNPSRRSSVIKMKDIASIMHPPTVNKSTETNITVSYPNVFVTTENTVSSTVNIITNPTEIKDVNTPNTESSVKTEEPPVTSVITESSLPPEEITPSESVIGLQYEESPEASPSSVIENTTLRSTTVNILMIDNGVPDEVKLNIRDGISTTESTTIRHVEPSQTTLKIIEPQETYAKNHKNYEDTSEFVRNHQNKSNIDVNITTKEVKEDETTETVEVIPEDVPVTTTRKPGRNATGNGGLPRKVNMNARDRHRVVYHTDDDQVLRSRNREPEEEDGNDVAVYILGTFGIIPVAIAVLLTVRYCISRRKKIWESEKSPLTFVSTNEWEFPRSKLRLQTVLGQGNFGLVYKAEADDILGERATRLVAVKTIKDGASSQEKEDLMRELAILKQIGAHSNVVTLLGCCTEKEPSLLILEYVMYGKLLSFLRDNRTRKQYYNFSEETAELTAKDLTSFAYCVARGMEYLTSKGIIHRDLAARNILVDHNKICKVADFGMSRSVSEPGQIYEQAPAKGALPIRWMAPESLTYRVFTHKSDVWAFGILMWEIVTLGSTPYQSMCAREVIKQVRDGYRLERPNHCRAELYRVAATCWSHDPSKRPTFGEIKVELAELLEQGESQTYVDLESYIESISNSRTHQTTQVVNL